MRIPPNQTIIGPQLNGGVCWCSISGTRDTQAVSPPRRGLVSRIAAEGRMATTIDEPDSSAADKTEAKKLRGQKKTETPIYRMRVGDGGEPLPESDPSCF